MKYSKRSAVILVSCLALLIPTVSEAQTKAQKEIDAFLLQKETVKEHQIEFDIMKIFRSKNGFALLGRVESKRKSYVTFFDNDGDILWKKDYPYASKVSIFDNGEKIQINHITTLEYNPRHEQLNSIYDRQGNLLWEMMVTSPGLTISGDGRYGITTSVGGDDGGGRFQIFDLETREEMNTPIQGDYGYFRAYFIDNKRVLFLQQRSTSIRNEEAIKKLREEREKHKGESRDDRRRHRWEIGPKSSTEYHPLLFVVYNIATGNIETRKKLYSKGGEPVTMEFWGSNSTAISEDGQEVIMKVYNNRPQYYGKPDNDPATLMKLNMRGELIWEIKNFDHMRSIAILSDSKLLVIGIPSNKMYLVDTINGAIEWRYNHNKARGSMVPVSFYIKNDILYLQTSHISGFTAFDFHVINMKTGKQLSFTLDRKNIIYLNLNPENQMKIDKGSRKLILSQSD